MPGPRPISRRRLLQGATSSAALALAGCSGSARSAVPGQPGSTGGGAGTRTVIPGLSNDATTAAPTPILPTPAPTPRPASARERVLLEGTASATTLSIRHSGVRGPAVMVLGGVHGNEPGAWLAADQVAAWEPAAGSLIVLPRANVQGIAGFVRTTDDIGDLNRFYPGNLESPFLMERMAALILDTCREFGVSVLLDMHESWGFYVEHPDPSAAALGQTVTPGAGPLSPGLARDVVSRMNAAIGGTRNELLLRDGAAFRRPDATPSPGATNRGRSSLSAGGHVPGLTPILVEMGQENQQVARRTELHLSVARTLLELVGVA